MGSRATNLALAVGSALASLLLLEGVLRLVTGPLFLTSPFVGFPWMAYDPVLGWRNVPGTWVVGAGDPARAGNAAVTIDALGFRGPEVSREKEDGTLRIVCLGDSGTFGVVNAAPAGEKPRWLPGVGYPDVLRSRLQRQGMSRVEVINAGVVGYSSAHGLRQLMVQILDLSPDVITVRFGANDLKLSWAPQRRALEPSSPLVRRLFYRVDDWKLTRLAMAAYETLPLHPAANTVKWTTERQLRRSLERIIEIGRERGIRVLLLDYPFSHLRSADARADAFERIGRLRERQLQGIIGQVAREARVPLLSTVGPFARHDQPVFDAADPVHPNPRGMELLGGLLFGRLRALGWLDGKPGDAARGDLHSLVRSDADPLPAP
jgi:lysophospholipase L1-like esterase